MPEMEFTNEENTEMKKTECLPTHLALDDAIAVKCIVADAGTNVSEYIRGLIMADIKARRDSAHATLLALGYPREQIERLERTKPKN